MSDDLGGLFDDSDDDLGSLFGDDEAVSSESVPDVPSSWANTTEPSNDSLDDLFADDPAPAPTSKSAPAPAPEVRETKRPEKKKPLVLGELSRPTKPLSFGTSAPKESTPVVVEKTEPVSKPEVHVETTAPTSAPAEPEAPAVTSFDKTRAAANAAGSSLNEQAAREMAARAEMERAARRYDDTGRLWSYIDRITATIAGITTVTNKLRLFELTRDHYIDNMQRRELKEMVEPVMAANGIAVANPQDYKFVMEMLYDELLGISVLGELWRDDEVTEIMVDRWDKIVVERQGVLIPTRLKFRDAGHANSIARAMAMRVSNRVVSNSTPLVTAELPGARVTFAYGPVIRGGLSITMRKFRDLLTIDKLLEFKSLTPEMAEFLSMCVRGRATILISGGTGTGKTTIINLLSSFIPDTERVITIEDAFELDLSNSNWLALQTKEKASADDDVSVTLADLLWSTLRMRPDRVVVGEIREGQAAEVMLQAAETGHDGTMTTIHGNSGYRTLNTRFPNILRRVQNTPEDVIRQTLANSFHLVVQVTRKRGKRYISEISVVDETCYHDGVIKPDTIFKGAVDRGGVVEFKRVGGVRADTDLYEKLLDAGYDMHDWEA